MHSQTVKTEHIGRDGLGDCILTVVRLECVPSDASLRRSTGQNRGFCRRRVKPAALVSFRTRVRRFIRRKSIRSHGVAGSRWFHARLHQVNCADARWLHMAGHWLRVVSVRRRPRRALAATLEWRTTSQQCYRVPPCRPRRHFLDRHNGRLGELERWKTHSVPGSCWLAYRLDS